MTDPYLVADAYLVATVQAASRIAYRLGFTTHGDRYDTEHRRLRQVFQDQYISPRGRMASDSQAAYCLAYQFSLLEDTQLQGASERLLRLVTKDEFKIATGFVGTPALTHALVEAGHLNVAYRMLQEKGCPSWLYPLTKGATTVWERWDSIMEDDSINVGQMVIPLTDSILARRDDIVQPLLTWGCGQFPSHSRWWYQSVGAGIPEHSYPTPTRRVGDICLDIHHHSVRQSLCQMDLGERDDGDRHGDTSEYQRGSSSGFVTYR